MAITIRTGANGSYKSAYSAYFVILKALKAGRIVVTNFEGMQPLDQIEKRLNITFPSTARLIRISSRDETGIFLWTYFFCWMPIGAQVVIDECQDIYSTKIGFDMKKIKCRPIADFITKEENDNLLPTSFLNLFDSRYVPVDMDKLDTNEIDDRGVAEYDDLGRPIYPHTFNGAFMRHRKYDWDIELLSPDWTQIDTGIKMCAEQCFYQKQRDQYPWAIRKPYIFKHEKTVTKPSIPKGYHVNLVTEKIPLDTFLLYKSTATGSVKNAGAMNTVFRSPKLIAVVLLFIACMGYLGYALSNMVFDNDQPISQPEAVTNPIESTTEDNQLARIQVPDVLPNGGDSHQGDNSRIQSHVNRLDIASLLPFEGFKAIYLTGHVRKFDFRKREYNFVVTLEVDTDEGTFVVNDRYFARNDIRYEFIDDCLLEMHHEGLSKIITCRPRSNGDVVATQTSAQQAQVSLF
ncbi:zonular occludens toxin domain-containing protein [uncultured Vibrio sp.]|uniref:zonular occludens toxin domain-containing protein n=1 Tax=uncultured Vibrio sp. TaxID=114054 RepID=UPI0026010158|nr:zonular occludens toxin domain-containing protein [uncultured Vibrio sp.]